MPTADTDERITARYVIPSLPSRAVTPNLQPPAPFLASEAPAPPPAPNNPEVEKKVLVYPASSHCTTPGEYVSPMTTGGCFSGVAGQQHWAFEEPAHRDQEFCQQSQHRQRGDCSRSQKSGNDTEREHGMRSTMLTITGIDV